MLDAVGAGEALQCPSLLAVDDFVHFDSGHFRQHRSELVECVGVLGEYGLELNVFGSGGKRCQPLHHRHQLIWSESAVVFEPVCPQVFVALDGVEDVQS